MLIAALTSGCERESKGPRVFNHPPATVGPPPDLSQFDPPPNAQSAPEVTQAPAETKPEPPPITTTPPADASTELHPEVAGLVEMAKRGVGDEALLAYVEQNPLTHRMTPETIIYLNDIGISEAVVAMMIRQGDTEPVEKKRRANQCH